MLPIQRDDGRILLIERKKMCKNWRFNSGGSLSLFLSRSFRRTDPKKRFALSIKCIYVFVYVRVCVYGSLFVCGFASAHNNLLYLIPIVWWKTLMGEGKSAASREADASGWAGLRQAHIFSFLGPKSFLYLSLFLSMFFSLQNILCFLFLPFSAFLCLSLHFSYSLLPSFLLYVFILLKFFLDLFWFLPSDPFIIKWENNASDP